MLGRGAYGQVSLAWDTEEDRLVAIKVQQRASESAKRGMMFCQSVPHHPNVLRILDTFVSGLELSLVFEYCILSLGDIWKRAQAFLDWDKARRYSQQVLHGIAHLHRNDVAHRDINMSNVLVGEDSGREVCVVADLGLAACASYSILDRDVTKAWYRAPRGLLPRRPAFGSADDF